MRRSLGNVLGVVLLGVLVAAGYVAAKYWQEKSQAPFQRIDGGGDCDLGATACSVRLDNAVVSLSIAPGLALMKPLDLAVTYSGESVDRVWVDVRGLNMDMGLNRTELRQAATGVWKGETILPVCTQRRMQWEAAVQLEFASGTRVEIAFPFATTRP